MPVSAISTYNQNHEWAVESDSAGHIRIHRFRNGRNAGTTLGNQLMIGSS